MRFAKIVDGDGRPAFRSYRSADGAYQILFHANANRPGGGYGAWAATRLFGPYPLAAADAASGFKTTMRECIAWCAANAERTPAPPDPDTEAVPTDTGHGRSAAGQP
jgi:hypothetical protein